jgi:hypothetical protein
VDWATFAKPIEMTSFRRSLEGILMPPIEAGLSIERVVEPLPTEDFRKSDLKRYLKLKYRRAFLHVRAINRNYSRRQASGLSFEAILRTRRQVFQIGQFHVVGDLSKPQTWSNIPMKQAFSKSTPTHRE